MFLCSQYDGNEFASTPLAENEMEKRRDETKEGKDLEEITNVAYQKSLLLHPLVYRLTAISQLQHRWMAL